MIRYEQVNGFSVTGHYVDIYIGVRQMRAVKDILISFVSHLGVGVGCLCILSVSKDDAVW